VFSLNLFYHFCVKKEMTELTELEKYIHIYFGVSFEDTSKISTFFKPLKLKKGDYFLKAGRYSDRLGFVQTGIIREYVFINDKEITKWISTKGYFVVDLSSFAFQQRARWNIQALTDCELYVIDNLSYQSIGEVIPSWPKLEKLFIAKCFTVLEDRVLQHLSMTAEERYNQLFSFNKELFNQVPLQYLASMLGITPETLSRLRKKATGEIGSN
jgi:CRP/FNR family transcriptional regulator, anaerobic regulatory protein